MDDILRANEAFYLAFAHGDVTGMLNLWAATDAVAVVHPGWPPLLGRSMVMKSWRDILSEGPPEVRCSQPTAHRVSDTVAFVICLEVVDEIHHMVATNIFVLEDGEWRMTMHQAGPMTQVLHAPATDAWN